MYLQQENYVLKMKLTDQKATTVPTAAAVVAPEKPQNTVVSTPSTIPSSFFAQLQQSLPQSVQQMIQQALQVKIPTLNTTTTISSVQNTTTAISSVQLETMTSKKSN